MKAQLAFFAALLVTGDLAVAASAAVDANGNVLPPDEGAGKQDQAAELAKQLQNPVAFLISVPFQNNFQFNLEPNDDGFVTYSTFSGHSDFHQQRLQSDHSDESFGLSRRMMSFPAQARAAWMISCKVFSSRPRSPLRCSLCLLP